MCFDTEINAVRGAERRLYGACQFQTLLRGGKGYILNIDI